ncbi:MAG: Trm112 family protein [Terracidiphilus sp.]
MPNADQPQFDAGLLSRMACPACHGELRLGEGKVGCADCGRAYPVIDGIPVLIAERADPGHPKAHDN